MAELTAVTNATSTATTAEGGTSSSSPVEIGPSSPAQVNVTPDEILWRSPVPVEGLSLRLDLETIFQLFNIKIVLADIQAEPVDLIIERSSDFGATWSVYQYFLSNCTKFQSNANSNPSSSTSRTIEATCEQQNSLKYEFNVISQDSLNDGPIARSMAQLEYSKISNLRFNMSTTSTGDLSTLTGSGSGGGKNGSTNGTNVTSSSTSNGSYFAIKEIVINGTCFCNGHSSKCIPAQVDQTLVPDMIYGRCQCSHFTTGANCQECLALYNDGEWRPAFAGEKNECKCKLIT